MYPLAPPRVSFWILIFKATSQNNQEMGIFRKLSNDHANMKFKNYLWKGLEGTFDDNISKFDDNWCKFRLRKHEQVNLAKKH